MMETVIQVAGICLAAAGAASLLRKDSPEAGLLLAVAAVLAGAGLLAGAVRTLASLGDELVAMTGLSPALFAPLLKVTAVALIARVGAALCVDAGQSALARVMEAAGAVCALGCAVPLLEAVIELIQGWI